MRVGALYAVLRLETGAFHSALSRAESRWSRFGGFLKAGGILAAQAIAVVGGASVFMAAKFESSMQKSLAIMGDVSVEMKAKLEGAARSIAKETTFSASEAAEAYYFLASAGLTAAQSVKAMPVAARFAQAGTLDLEKATELLLDSQTVMGLRSKDAATNQENLARVSDVLSRAQMKSNATLQQMAEALTTKAGPALRLLNKDVEEGTAVLAVMANQGLKGRAAGTALGIVLRELQTKALKNGDAFKELGVRVYDSNGKMRNMADIIGDLEGAMDGLSDKQQKQVLLQLGFTDRSSSFIQQLLGQSDAIRRYERDLRKAGGTTKDVADKQVDTFSGQLEIMWHKIQDVGITIGNALLPSLRDAVEWFGNWVDKNHELIATIAVGVFNAILAILAGMGDLIRFISNTFGPVFDTVGDIVGDFMNVLKMLFDPNGEGAGGIKQFKDQFGGIGDTVVSVFELAQGVIENAGPIISDWITWVAEELLPRLGDAFNWFSENVLPFFQEVLEGVVSWFEDNWPTISEIAGQVFGALRSGFEIIMNVIATVVPIIWAILEPVAKALLPAIGLAASALLGVIRFVFGAIGVVWQAVADAAKTTGRAIGDAFRWLGDFFGGLWDGITGTFKTAINVIIDLVNGFVGFLNGLHVDIPSITIPGIGATFGGGSIDPFNIPTIPHLARGGRGLGGGLALVGEYGPELAYLPRGSSVFSADQTRGMLSGSGRVVVEVRDPDGAIRGGGYSQRQVEKVLQSGLERLLGGAQTLAARS